MRVFPVLIILLYPSLLFSAPVPKNKVKKDEMLIVGTWAVVNYDAGGMGAPSTKEVARLSFVFQADGGFVYGDGDKIGDYEGTFILDSNAKIKTIDLTGTLRKRILPVACPGIYELVDDTLIICMVNGGNEARPTEFQAKDNIVVVLTLKRVTEERK